MGLAVSLWLFSYYWFTTVESAVSTVYYLGLDSGLILGMGSDGLAAPKDSFRKGSLMFFIEILEGLFETRDILDMREAPILLAKSSTGPPFRKTQTDLIGSS